jgi:hypothetical protein
VAFFYWRRLFGDSSHAFDQAIALELQSDGSFAGHTSAAYANMVGPFGGISAAQMMNAVLLHPDRLGEPVSLTINFAAALAHGPFTVQAAPRAPTDPPSTGSSRCCKTVRPC